MSPSYVTILIIRVLVIIKSFVSYTHTFVLTTVTLLLYRPIVSHTCTHASTYSISIMTFDLILIPRSSLDLSLLRFHNVHLVKNLFLCFYYVYLITYICIIKMVISFKLCAQLYNSHQVWPIIIFHK